MSCEFTLDYEGGLRAIHEKRPSLILLDINLGDQTGFKLCKELRETSDVPIREGEGLGLYVSALAHSSVLKEPGSKDLHVVQAQAYLLDTVAVEQLLSQMRDLGIQPGRAELLWVAFYLSSHLIKT